MAYEGWMTYNGVEFINVARTARLSQALGLGTVRVREDITALLHGRFGVGAAGGFGMGGFGLGGFGLGGSAGPADYSDPTETPWYDAQHPASSEFAGVIPLEVSGLDDSSRESVVTEYINSGGNAGRARNSTQALVFNVALVATTERGAEYGKQWLGRMLSWSILGDSACVGADLHYLRSADEEAPLAHRRDVSLTRGISVTRKRVGRCATTWLVTFTLTAADPFEYGEVEPKLTSLGGATASGPDLLTYGTLDLVQSSCPVYDYSPIFDPLYPALVPSPTAPEFFPAGWGIEDGTTFRRHWARVSGAEPSQLLSIPLIKITSPGEARSIRVSVWSGMVTNDEQCGPLWSAVVTYKPPGLDMYLDSEQQAAYAWDGASPSVRRTDSLVYAPDANPVEWSAFSNEGDLLVTLDLKAKPGGFEGDGDLRMALSLISKSD